VHSQVSPHKEERERERVENIYCDSKLRASVAEQIFSANNTNNRCNRLSEPMTVS
jgi:hypothetical protein